MAKRATLLMVIALAVLSLVSAAAYNTAVVTSGAQFQVTSTDTAKLALIPKSTTVAGNKDGTATVSNGKLVLDFSSVQPNSIYTWIDIFSVKNNSLDTLDITVNCTGTTNLSFSSDGGSTWSSSLSKTGVANNVLVPVSVKLTVPGTDVPGAPIAATITVNAALPTP